MSPAVVFGLALLAGIGVIVGLLLLPGWLKQSRRGALAGAVTCKSHLQTIGIAIRAYADDHDGWMPSSWDNAFALIAPYLSDEDRATVWHCPVNTFGTDPADLCSYGVNADETDGDTHDHNRFHRNPETGEYAVFRQSGRASADGRTDLYPGPFAHRMCGGGDRQAGVRLSQLAPNTILMAELWSPNNRLDLDDPRAPMRGTGPRGRLSVLIREYGEWRKPKFDERGHLRDAGSYLFLKPYQGRGIPIERMYHNGRIHVLYANGQVALVPIRRLIQPPPDGIAPRNVKGDLLTESPWTRFNDRGNVRP